MENYTIKSINQQANDLLKGGGKMTNTVNCMECGQASTDTNTVRTYHNPDWLHDHLKPAHITRCEQCYDESVAAHQIWSMECDCFGQLLQGKGGKYRIGAVDNSAILQCLTKRGRK